MYYKLINIAMKNVILLFIIFTLVSCLNKSSENRVAKNENQIESFQVSEVEELTDAFDFTEGPAVDAEGNVYYTNIPQHMILIWTTENQLDTFRVNSGRANGLYFDKDDNLLVCEGEKGQITSIGADGDYTAIATQYDGKRFNQPNDLWPDGKGGVYFTDPKYGGDEGPLPQDGMHVYYIAPNRESVVRVINDLEKPNGVLGTPDGKTLYVTDSEGEKTYKYAIKEDGSLTNKTLFVAVGCDGMTLDKQGNVYLTTNGKKAVDIFSPNGVLLESIEIPQQPSNLCFGGKERNELFITARKSIYRVALNAYGVD
jgi:gluconolactonase